MFAKPSLHTPPPLNPAIPSVPPFGIRGVLCLALFKASWALLVIFQNAALLPVALLQIAGLALHPAPRQAVPSALLCAVSGILLDQCLSVAGILVFPDVLLPAWLMLLWLAWGLALTFGLRFLHALPRPLLAVIGACAGAGSYGAGYLLGAVDFGLASTTVLLILALLWACVLPLQVYLVSQLSGVSR